MHKVIFAASYLCKAHTKYFSDGTHPFECSRSEGASRGFQGAFKGVGVNSTPSVKTVGYHRGNERLKLVELQSDKSSTVLDHQAGSYIEADLNETWDYLEKKRVVSSDFVAIRFRLDIEPDILAKRRRFKYVERLYNHIEKSIRSALGQVGKARSTDVSHLKAINSWQQEQGQMFLHIVLFIEGSIFDQVLYDQNTEDYLHSFLADVVSYTYSFGEQQARDKLTIHSMHRLTQGLGNSEDELRSLRRHIGYLCLSEPSISQASTLYCR